MIIEVRLTMVGFVFIVVLLALFNDDRDIKGSFLDVFFVEFDGLQVILAEKAFGITEYGLYGQLNDGFPFLL